MDVALPGFLVNAIMKCVTLALMQIVWNGELSEAFNPSRGVRHGSRVTVFICSLHGTTVPSNPATR